MTKIRVAVAIGLVVVGVVVIAVGVWVVQQFWWLLAVSAAVFAATKYFTRRRARKAFYGRLPEVPRLW